MILFPCFFEKHYGIERGQSYTHTMYTVLAVAYPVFLKLFLTLIT